MKELIAIVSIYIPSTTQLIEIEPLWENLEEIKVKYLFLQIGYDEFVTTVDIPTLIAIDRAYRQATDSSTHDTMPTIGALSSTDNISVSIQIVTRCHAEIVKNALRYL